MALIFREDAYTRSCRATVTGVDDQGIRLSDTVFYPMGGGQPGDTGTVRFDGITVRIVDTLKGEEPDEVIHVPEAGSTLPPVGTVVDAAIDWDRRHRHMRMHTALHLLCSLVPGSVTGGQVAADKSRLDFNVPTASLDKRALSEALNQLIAEDRPVRPRWITDEALAAQPELVRTMSVQPPAGSGRVRLLDIDGVDLQPCGGTHVARTGEIGTVEVTKIENKGKQNRRVVIALKA